MKSNIITFCAIIAMGMSSAVAAQERGAVRAGFSAETLKGQKILLFRPTVSVGSQATGGTAEPNADWTAEARKLLLAEVRHRRSDFSNEIVEEPDVAGADAELLSSHRALFTAVANSVMVYQFFVGNRLPTRKNKAFDWTLGDETK
jgi:hypothetical protein